MSDYSLVPADHQPDFDDVSLVPVEHDPFRADGTLQWTQTQTAQVQPLSPSQQAATGVEPNADAPADQSKPAQPDRSSHAAQSDSYPTADAAAMAALQNIYRTSQRHGDKYAGRVYHKWLGFGDYSYTGPFEGTPYSSEPGNSVLGPLFHSLGVNAGAYHTHTRGMDPTLDEEYSPGDKIQSDSEREPSFLATPSGIFKKYTPVPNQPSLGRVSVLGNTKDFYNSLNLPDALGPR